MLLMAYAEGCVTYQEFSIRYEVYAVNKESLFSFSECR